MAQMRGHEDETVQSSRSEGIGPSSAAATKSCRLVDADTKGQHIEKRNIVSVVRPIFPSRSWLMRTGRPPIRYSLALRVGAEPPTSIPRQSPGTRKRRTVGSSTPARATHLDLRYCSWSCRVPWRGILVFSLAAFLASRKINGTLSAHFRAEKFRAVSNRRPAAGPFGLVRRSRSNSFTVLRGCSVFWQNSTR